jgi:hypothetical protein
MPEIKEKIRNEIKNEDPTAEDFHFVKVVSNFIESDVLYVSWKSEKMGQDESFYYVLSDKNGELTFYDDGIVAIEKMKDMLDRRRTFFQRLQEFSLFEVMAAVIAIAVTLVFIILSLVSIQNPNALSKEFTGIFGIIVGYYFGKNIPAAK